MIVARLGEKAPIGLLLAHCNLFGYFLKLLWPLCAIFDLLPRDAAKRSVFLVLGFILVLVSVLIAISF